MPLDEQEARCVDLVCRHLATVHGGAWVISSDLDEIHQNVATPEVLVTNGTTTAAIEVKQLIGDNEYLTYQESMRSLVRSLTPSCGGHYTLVPALDFRLPMEPRFRAHVRREIERVALKLAPEEKGAIRIPRQANLSLIKGAGPEFIFCCHNSTGHLVRAASPRLTGVFRLVDDGMWEHSFVTDEAKVAFQDALVAACDARLRGETLPFTWMEEWQLTRGAADAEDGVWLIAVTEARDVYGAVAEGVSIMLEKAKTKFEHRRWGDLHVVVFDRAGVLMTVAGVAEVAAGFEPEDLGAIDLIFVADGDLIQQVWPTH